jgi:hypothetical protein
VKTKVVTEFRECATAAVLGREMPPPRPPRRFGGTGPLQTARAVLHVNTRRGAGVGFRDVFDGEHPFENFPNGNNCFHLENSRTKKPRGGGLSALPGALGVNSFSTGI